MNCLSSSGNEIHVEIKLVKNVRESKKEERKKEGKRKRGQEEGRKYEMMKRQKYYNNQKNVLSIAS